MSDKENKSYIELYKEYLELLEAKEKAEELVIRNTIREAKRKKEEASKEIINECERMKRELNLLRMSY